MVRDTVAIDTFAIFATSWMLTPVSHNTWCHVLSTPVALPSTSASRTTRGRADSTNGKHLAAAILPVRIFVMRARLPIHRVSLAKYLIQRNQGRRILLA